MKLNKYIYQLGIEKQINLYCFNKSNPYYPWGLSTNFYFQDNLEIRELDFVEKSIFLENKKKNILVIDLKDVEDIDIQKFITNNNMTEICKSSPKHLIPLLRGTQVLVLYSD